MQIATRLHLSWLFAPLLATLAFWACFGACIDAPAAAPPQARVLGLWDPLACGEPHRVVIELEDDEGALLTRSTPCVLGGVVIDVPHFGVWHGRIYAWALDVAPHSIATVEVSVEQPVVRWEVATPR